MNPAFLRLSSIALVCSVALEAAPLLEHLDAPEKLDSGTLRGWRGALSGHPVLLLIAGMGKVNAAHALTLLSAREPIRAVLGFGVAGAYPGSGLAIGEVALAESEHYGDEGVETPEGWLSCEGIGIPLVERGSQRYFNDFPVDNDGLSAAVRAFEQWGRPLPRGPFVTVSNCSGTTARGDQLARRFGALCETMEGAAYAHTALLIGAPFLEVRGISNRVEDRDRGSWRLPEAAAAAAETVPSLVEAWLTTLAAPAGS